MYEQALIFLTSFGLIFLGTIALGMPNLVRRYLEKSVRYEEPETWYDYLWYQPRPYPIWGIYVMGAVFVIVGSLLSLNCLAYF